jgi:hypothetical protein
MVFYIIFYLNKYLQKVEKDFKDIKVYYEISEDFIRGDNGNLQFEIPIKEIIKVLETGRFFLISRDKDGELIFSKRQISNSDLVSLKELFLEKSR